MELIDILGLSVVGSMISIVFDLFKDKLTKNRLYKQGAIVILSILIGGVYYFLNNTNLMASILGVLAASQVAYNFLLKNYR